MPSDHQIVAMTIAAMANCWSVSQTMGEPPRASVTLAISPCRGEKHDLPDQRDHRYRQDLAEEEERAQHGLGACLAVECRGEDQAR